VLTLGSDGLYYPASASSSSLLIKAETTPAAAVSQQAAPAAVMTANTTASEPAAAASYSAFRSYCSPMVAGLPTVTTPRGSEDVSVYVVYLSRFDFQSPSAPAGSLCPLSSCSTAHFLILFLTHLLTSPFPVFLSPLCPLSISLCDLFLIHSPFSC
jgi:hypothetical protein